MQKEVNGIPYVVHNTAHSRKISIFVRSEGRVVVSKSPRVSIADVEKIMWEKFSWIEEMVRKQLAKPKKILAHYSIKDFKENKERARNFATERLLYFNQFYKHKLGKVYIRNQKSRWGSCSSKGNLNFNYKIVFLPIELAEYIIVHELCHLGEMNHGKNFWALVSKIVPDHKEKRKKIKLY